MNAETGKKIGPLEEIKHAYNTDAASYDAKWSSDSRQVTITYTLEDRNSYTISYLVERGRATRISGPAKTDEVK